MNFFQNISKTELKKKKGNTLKAAWILSLGAPLVTGIAFILGRTNILLADFFRRTAELLALFLSWVVFRKVAKGSNREYNYGYYKLEDVSSLFVGLIMIVSFVIILYSSLNRLLHPTPSGWLIPGLIIASLGFLVNGWFWQQNYRLNNRESTPVFEAQWRLYRAKTLIDFFIIITLIMDMTLSSNLWPIYIDFFASLVVACILLISGFHLFNRSLKNLIDKAPIAVEKIKNEIEQLLIEGIKISKICNRKAGGCFFIDIYVVVKEGKKIKEIQKVREKIIRKLSDEFPPAEVRIILNN